MINIPTCVIIFLSVLQSIDDENSLRHRLLEMDGEHLNLQARSDMSENNKDFDYNTIPIDSIANKRMPYINCNRSIFCSNVGFDLSDQLKPENRILVENILLKMHDIVYYIFNVVEVLVKLAKDNFIKLSDNINIKFESEKKVNTEIQEFIKLLNPQSEPFILKNGAYRLLVEVENYFRLSSGVDFFILFCKNQPSVVLNDLFYIERLNIKSITNYLLDVSSIYNQILIDLMELNDTYNVIKNDEYY